MSTIINSKICFRADKEKINTRTGEYEDPLMRWPLRAASYTNEVGEVLRPLIGNYATLGWAPVMMYVGADIYDKYKNNENEYSPSSERCLKQTIYQGISTLILPVVSSRLGQHLFAQFGRLTNENLSINPQLQISNIAESYITNGKLQNIQGNEEKCINDFLSIVHNKIEFKRQDQSSKSPIKNILYKAEEILSIFLGVNNTKNLNNYAEKTIRDLIQLQKKLINPDEEIKNSRLYKSYLNYMELGQTPNIALQSVLKDFQQKKILKGKLVMTFGGLAMVLATVKPIDKFVDNFIFGKVINPGFEKAEHIEIKNLNTKLLNNINRHKINILTDINPN